MNALLAPRVKETSTTTGTGTLSLAGAVSGFQTFVAGFGTGQKCYYTIVHGTAWEVGEGTVTDLATDTLSRDTILSSSAGGAALNLGAGTKTVFCDVTRESVIVPAGHIYGLSLTNNGSDAVNDIDFTTGECTSDDATAAARVQISPAAMTKRLDAVWAAGTGQGGRLSTDALANGTWHCFAFKPGASPDDFFFSTSVNPTPPLGTKKRRIASILREAASVIGFLQTGDEFLRTGASLNINRSNPGTSPLTETLSVPTGISVVALLNVLCEKGSNDGKLLLSTLSIAAASPSVTVAPLAHAFMFAAGGAAGQVQVRTNTSGQIRSQLTSSGSSDFVRAATIGWIDRRGRDA